MGLSGGPARLVGLVRGEQPRQWWHPQRVERHEAILGPLHEWHRGHDVRDGDRFAGDRGRKSVVAAARDGEPGEEGRALGPDVGEHLLPQVLRHQVLAHARRELGERRPSATAAEDSHVDLSCFGERLKLVVVEDEVGFPDPRQLPRLSRGVRS